MGSVDKLIKYRINGIAGYTWCQNNGYSYPAFLRLKKAGCSDKKITCFMQKNYMKRTPKEEAIEQIRDMIEFSDNIDTFKKAKQEFAKWFTDHYYEDELWDYVTGKMDYLPSTKNMELWRVIPGELAYEVSNRGRVRHVTDGIIKLMIPQYKPRRNKRGIINRYHLVVKTSNTYKPLFRIVADAWLPKPPNDKDYVVMPIDGRIDNPRASNLCWISRKLVSAKTGPQKQKSCRVALLDDDGNTIEEFDSIRQASKSLGLSYTTISIYSRGLCKNPKLNIKLLEKGESVIGQWEGEKVQLLNSSGRILSEYTSAASAAKELGIHKFTVCSICNYVTKSPSLRLRWASSVKRKAAMARYEQVKQQNIGRTKAKELRINAYGPIIKDLVNNYTKSKDHAPPKSLI